MMRPRNLKPFLCAALLVLSVPGAASATTGAAVRTSAAHMSLNLLSSKIQAYAGPLGPFRDGVWTSSNPLCWACNQGGPATAAAAVYMLTGRTKPRLFRDARATIDVAISTRQRPDGAFVGAPGDTQSADVATMFFGVEEGNTYLELSSVLDRTRRARWQKSLTAAANYLIHNGNLTWYTNGNITLGNAELFYLVWRATGNRRFLSAYDQAWTFALHPPQSQSPGRGLVLVKAPKRPDGSDGAGYLTETGAGGTGFDPEYTELQLDVASRLYLLSGDPRAKWLANLLVNVLLPRMNRSNWTLDTSGGTRHGETGRWVPVITSAFAVLGLRGGRSDLMAYVLPQLSGIEVPYADPRNDYGEVYRRALGNDIAVIALVTNLGRVGATARGGIPIRAPRPG